MSGSRSELQGKYHISRNAVPCVCQQQLWRCQLYCNNSSNTNTAAVTEFVDVFNDSRAKAVCNLQSALA
jgi:hypothetical protein